MNELNNLDTIIKEYGIKYIFVESGRAAVEEKLEDAGDDPNDYPTAQFWCELSWGNGGNGDKYDFAHNDIGDTAGEAFQNCINAFIQYVRDGVEDEVAAAKDAGIYSKLIGVTE